MCRIIDSQDNDDYRVVGAVEHVLAGNVVVVSRSTTRATQPAGVERLLTSLLQSLAMIALKTYANMNATRIKEGSHLIYSCVTIWPL
jgi:hypothetical protein